MNQTVSVDVAQDKLPALPAHALAGNEGIITEQGTPVARLVPVVTHSTKKRVARLNRGAISTTEDFDEPLPDSFGWAIRTKHPELIKERSPVRHRARSK